MNIYTEMNQKSQFMTATIYFGFGFICLASEFCGGGVAQSGDGVAHTATKGKGYKLLGSLKLNKAFAA